MSAKQTEGWKIGTVKTVSHGYSEEFMKNIKFELTSFHLHIFAMALMLCDHMWHAVIPGNDWMTAIGRIAFPIFAFMTVEGFFHTKNLKKYAERLLFFAVVSEIPFNLVAGGRIFYPLHQNVFWTFLIGIGLIFINEKFKEKNLTVRVLVGAGTFAIGFFAGILTLCDYHYAGIFTVLVFYFFRGRKWWCFLGQAICLWYINFEMLGGFEYIFVVFGEGIHVVRQGLAILALVPIWLYKGKQGIYNKGIKAFYYWFYPAHLFILWIISEIIA